MSLVFAVGRWVFSLSMSLSRVEDEEPEVASLNSDVDFAFGFQPTGPGGDD